MPKILIEISPEGGTTIKAQGYRGASCLDATREIEHALGQVVNDRKTPEFQLGQKQAGGQSPGRVKQ